jgi:Uma2 family endonuclease
MFQLPLEAYRSPDAAWILLERWEALSPEHRSAFPPLCPDFVVELRSASDNLRFSPGQNAGIPGEWCTTRLVD